MASLAYLLLTYALSLPAMLLAGRFEQSSDLIAWLKIAWLAAFAWHALTWRAKVPAGGPSGLAVSAGIGLTWTAVLMMYAYEYVAMMPFSLQVAITSPADSYRTLVQVVGPGGLVLGIAAVAVVAVLLALAAARLLRAARSKLPQARLNAAATLACVGALAYLAAADARYAAIELSRTAQDMAYPLRAPDYSKLSVRSTESFIILQLESVNADALFRRAGDGRLERRIAQPGLETVLREGGGTLFPFFYSNALQTHLAQENILCGVSGNANGAPVLVAHTGGFPNRLCLPRHLAEAGFATVFLYSYFDMSFYSYQAFQKLVGYSDIAYGPGLMAEGDRRHRWGYDDCVFYERAFDYLEKRGLARRERLFAYFQVSMNHVPFAGTRKYPEAHPFPAAATPLEHYQNSLAEQDHCLGVFWRRFRALARDDVHLLIIPDHSILVNGLDGPRDSEFRTWVAYVPPARRSAQFPAHEVLDLVPSHAQVYPTVLELLGAPRTPQSFAFALRGERRPPDYDDCHLLARPFHSILAARSSSLAEYHLRRGELRRADDSWEPMDLRVYRARHGCR